jgi:hypothetical protein
MMGAHRKGAHHGWPIKYTPANNNGARYLLQLMYLFECIGNTGKEKVQ